MKRQKAIINLGTSYIILCGKNIHTGRMNEIGGTWNFATKEEALEEFNKDIKALRDEKDFSFYIV